MDFGPWIRPTCGRLDEMNPAARYALESSALAQLPQELAQALRNAYHLDPSVNAFTSIVSPQGVSLASPSRRELMPLSRGSLRVHRLEQRTAPWRTCGGQGPPLHSRLADNCRFPYAQECALLALCGCETPLMLLSPKITRVRLMPRLSGD